MPHSISAKKRVRQNIKRRARNRAMKSALRTQIKKFLRVLATGDLAAAEAEFRATARKLDKVSQKGVIHDRAAARHKSRLAAKLQALRAKLAPPAAPAAQETPPVPPQPSQAQS